MFLIYSDRSYGSWIYLWNQFLSPLKIWVRIPFIERCIHCIHDWSYLTIGCYSLQQYVIVCQWHATACWFFPVTTVFSTTKTDCYDITGLSMHFCKASFVGGSWWHWMLFYLQNKRTCTSLLSPIDGKE